MVRTLVVLCFLTTFLACKKKCDNCYSLIGTHQMAGTVVTDTYYIKQNTTIRNDSFILDFDNGHPYQDVFIFNLKDKSKVYYSGMGRHDIYMDGKLLIKAPAVITTYIKDTTINISGKYYPLHSYYYDENIGCGGTGYFYWSPDIGIVIIGSWSHNYRLHTNNRATDSNISYIIDVINHWEEERYSN